jgi:hypothetical protein
MSSPPYRWHLPRASWAPPWNTMIVLRQGQVLSTPFVTDVGCEDYGVTPLAGVGMDAPVPGRRRGQKPNKRLDKRTRELFPEDGKKEPKT